jgi:hypothetical protein
LTAADFGRERADGYVLAMVAVFENRKPITAAKFIIKSLLFVPLFSFTSRLELKPNSEQKVENIFVARHIAKPPVACWRFVSTEKPLKKTFVLLFNL